MLAACGYTWLTIASTTDLQLIANRSTSPLPIAGTEIPIAGFYFAAPFILLGAFLYLHLYLFRLWKLLADLPAVFPDGATLDAKAYPWLMNAMVRFRVLRLRGETSVTSLIETVLCVTLAWVLVPATLTALWLRYLPRHDWLVTLLQVGLIAFSVWSGQTFYRTTFNLFSPEFGGAMPRIATQVVFLILVTIFLVPLAFVSLETALCLIVIVLTGRGRLAMVAFGALLVATGLCSTCRAWTLPATACAAVLTMAFSWGAISGGLNAHLSAEDISVKPPGWTGLASDERKELAQVKGAQLERANLYHVEANRAFLANADLQDADLREASLDFADLRNANLQGADLSGAHLRSAHLQGALLKGARLVRTELDHSNLQSANLHGAQLQLASLIRAQAQGADLNSASLEGANLRHAQLQGSNLEGAQLQGAHLIAARLQCASLNGASLQGTRFSMALLWHVNATDFGLADLSGADFTTLVTDPERQVLRSSLDPGDPSTGEKIEKCLASDQTIEFISSFAALSGQVLVNNPVPKALSHVDQSLLTMDEVEYCKQLVRWLLSGGYRALFSDAYPALTEYATANEVVGRFVSDFSRPIPQPLPVQDLACEVLNGAEAGAIPIVARYEETLKQIAGRCSTHSP